MPFEPIEHTSDYAVKVSGRDLPELFASALMAMSAFLKKEAGGLEPKISRSLTVRAGNATQLLVDFLNECLLLSQSHKEIYTRAVFSRLEEKELSATLSGAAVDNFDDEIKAATYHQADVKQTSGGLWETAVIFDV